ncbi:MAG TPA: hypothetical protein VJX67_22840 [Blastocatellia bacterium]|nr:hypothetical protein [Blastocatellia bacterium]
MAISPTLKEIDDATAGWLRAEAARKGVSIKSLALELIHRVSDIRGENSQTSLPVVLGSDIWSEIDPQRVW